MVLAVPKGVPIASGQSPLKPSGVGIRVRVLRQQKNLSLEALGREARMSKNAVHDLERGKTQTPLPSNLEALAEVLGVSTDFLLTGWQRPGEAPVIRPESELSKREHIDAILRHAQALQRLEQTEVLQATEPEEGRVVVTPAGITYQHEPAMAAAEDLTPAVDASVREEEERDKPDIPETEEPA